MSLPLNPTHHLHPTHHPCCQSRNIAIDVLLMVLSTHCYRDSLCVSATVCDLHDCSQIKMPLETVRFFYTTYKIWWTGGSDYCLMPVFTHLSTWKYLRQIAWKCTIWNEELQKNSPQTPPTGEGDTPSPVPTPLGASTLVPSMDVVRS